MTPVALPEAGLLPIGSDLNQGWLIGLFLSQMKIPPAEARGKAGPTGTRQGDNLRRVLFQRCSLRPSGEGFVIGGTLESSRAGGVGIGGKL